MVGWAYTGVGSRKAPKSALRKMIYFGKRLAKHGAILRSGACRGPDRAFEIGCDSVNGPKEIYLPFAGYEDREEEESVYIRGACSEARKMAQAVHPAWFVCQEASMCFHTRNVYQFFGLDLETPSRFVICWTPGGFMEGGTRTVMELARIHRIPVFNLGSYSWDLKEIIKLVLERERRDEVPF